ncbi:MAG TPA: sodium:proton antiporter [Terrimesophilobacter sp.]|uniref:cation:proton antiporter n=1 Tax=Terrimesophilobacter sp. TaxID=2906435 RepID=UPI002F94C5F1
MDYAEYALAIVIGLVTVIAVAAFSRKLGIAAPLILVVVGIGISYLPGVGPIELPPEVILSGVLPLLLYSAAINVPLVDFRRNLDSISGLSVVLVIATAFGTGLLLWWILPGLDLAAGIALGAIISPTDAVAATALGKRLGLPPRLVTILEGESLVNDATALVLLRSAIAAGAGAVTLWSVVGDFAFAVAVAIAIGLVVGFLTVLVRSRLHDPVLDTAISFVVPFIAFIPAEEAHASGVLAVVVAGLYAGHNSARHFSPQARISERLNWRTLKFVLENGVFLLMGVEIASLIGHVQPEVLSIENTILLGLLMTVAVIALRGLFVAPLLFVIRRREKLAERQNTRFGEALERVRQLTLVTERMVRRRDRLARLYRRRSIDIQKQREAGLDWRGGVILSWSGMRGVVTLAAAQTLPRDVPYGPQLILIAFTVAIVTLLVQGGTLPWLIRLTGVLGTDRVADRRELAALLDELAAVGLAALDSRELELPGGAEPDAVVIDRVRNDTLLGAESAWERAENGVGAEALAQSPHQQYRILRRRIIEAERSALVDAMADGSYSSRIITRAQTMLDLEETRLEQLDNPSGS